MMQDLRQKTKIIMIIVALAFVGLMVFEWGMDISGRSAGLQTGELGRVNGEPIAYEAYSTAYQQLYDRAREQFGGEVPPDQIRQIEEAAFNEAVAEILLRQEMRRRGITVSDQEIQQAALWSPHPELMQNELFQTDGRFDIQKWQQFLSSPAVNEQLLLQLEQYYRSAIPRDKLMRQVMAGLYVSDAELWQMYRDQNETATVEYVSLDLSTLVPGDVQVTDREIRQHYDANKDRFRRPAVARLTIAVLSKEATAEDTVAAIQKAEALRQEIQGGADFATVAQRESADRASAAQGGDLGTFGRGQMTESFEQAAFALPVGTVSEPVESPFGLHLIQVEERTGEQVRARHILIPFAPSEEAEDRLYARADSLESLAERAGLQRAARATSATVRTGVTVSSEQSFVPEVGSVIEAIDWAQEEAGQADGAQVSPLFETPQAFYLVHRESFSPPGVMPLAEASPQIRRDLILQKKRARAREIGAQIAAEVRSGKALQQAARERNLQVETTGPFTRLSPNPVFGQATAAVGAAFGTPIGQVSNVMETPAGLFLVRPLERQEASREEFEAQKDQLRMMVQFQAQQQQAARFLQSLRRDAEIEDRRAEALRRS